MGSLGADNLDVLPQHLDALPSISSEELSQHNKPVSIGSLVLTERRGAHVGIGDCLLGISMRWWKRNHNAHRIACNSLEYDPDLQYIPLFAVTSKLFSNLYSKFYGRVMPFDGIARALSAYQHWTFYPTMAVTRMNLFVQSILLLASKKHDVPDRWMELGAIGFFYLWFFTLLPYLSSPLERLLCVLVSFAMTGVQHVQFCLNHFSSPVYQGSGHS